MHILAFILLFIIGSIMYATKGDYSGLEVIGKVILWFVVMAIMCFLLLNPALLVVAVIVIIIIVIALCSK